MVFKKELYKRKADCNVAVKSRFVHIRGSLKNRFNHLFDLVLDSREEIVDVKYSLLALPTKTRKVVNIENELYNCFHSEHEVFAFIFHYCSINFCDRNYFSIASSSLFLSVPG